MNAIPVATSVDPKIDPETRVNGIVVDEHVTVAYRNTGTKTYDIGAGEYKLRIERTSGFGEHAEGNVLIEEKGTGQNVRIKDQTFRSDKGGRMLTFNVSNLATVTISASAHSWISGAFGCRPTTFSVVIERVG